VDGTTTISDDAAERLRRALMVPQPVIIHKDQHEITAKVIIEGAARQTEG
jgi:hypothetical protein